ncbi:unnamed protein product [Caenorhabditis angaria]|uniref:UPAR/Ly6 domain-containing protein n=1 Tax=Caenorhabditis angaria TaxID=860376 RepID=A0A9P1IXS2_9PELO|nr:unnamed protein product [Caenorhabditis angaria]
MKGLIIFGIFFGISNALQCYEGEGSDLQTKECEAIDLWCIKMISGSNITRGCANVYDYCVDEDEGCYPETELLNGQIEKWCCCNKNLCNSSPEYLMSKFFSIFILLSIITFLVNNNN